MVRRLGAIGRRFGAISIAVGATAVVAGAQARAFEVAAIRENRSGEVRTSLVPYPNGTLTIENNTLRQMVRAAYGLWDYQIVGLPDWADRTHYDITAKAAGPATRLELMQQLRQLLETRFALATRHESREQPIFALVQVSPGKLGPKLTPSKPEDAGAHLFPILGSAGGMTGQAATMADLAGTLSNLQGRLVVDRTGLTGAYNFTLAASVGRAGGPLRPPGVPPDPVRAVRDDLPDMGTALREQLGLRLDSQRGPVDVLIVEHVEPATPD